MDLKNLGTTVSSHYEKIILSVILLALLGAAAYLPLRVSQSREAINRALEAVGRAPKKDSKPVDTAEIDQTLLRARAEPELNLSGEHNLFNPVVWKRRSDGSLYKIVSGEEEGPAGLKVLAIRPLEYRVEYDGVHRSGDRIRYKFIVLDETRGGRSSRPRQVYLSRDSSSKNDPFIITQINGPEDDPASVQIRFESGEVATVGLNRPYSRVAGYEADLVHENLGNRFTNVRAKQPGGIRLGPQTYNIVAINEGEVTLESATSKRWTVRLEATP
jgi:hypothetical protein